MSKARARRVRSYGVLLHLLRLGRDARARYCNMRSERASYSAKQESMVSRYRCGPACICAEIRSEIAALLEILIAGGALLPVPALLVGDQDDRREDGKLFNGEGDVRKIGDRAVAVLEVESVEKLLRLLLADLLAATPSWTAPSANTWPWHRPGLQAPPVNGEHFNGRRGGRFGVRGFGSDLVDNFRHEHL